MKPKTALAACAFFGRHIVPLLLAASIPAGLRYYQMDQFASRPAAFSWTLDILVLVGRLALVCVILGNGALLAGYRTARRLLQTPRQESNAAFSRAAERLSSEVRNYLADAAVYVFGALAANLLIGAVASSLPMQLLLKNLTVIPFTLVFLILLSRRLLKA
ncbi:hypothetical protein [Pelagicoccus sp. SDUM812003]|uniref:hypothetical protein n=1 Tax=Pelagicoccus sp. SDUM812003 TaxID=3041267 RepID=UPI00280E63E2|nr:hypothetical protein [Pelagicoccus sp. SDUM812003]MDQ8202381.1 hypothetical protein [Pelagicoccus sp. SDUM812003]